MKYLKIACCLLAACLALTGCAPKAVKIEPQGKAYFEYFDTVSYVYCYAADPAELFDERSAEAAAVLREYHQLFDIYHEYSGVNNLCTLNRHAGDDAIEVDPRLIDFLLYARDLYARTGGEMNVMMGAVLKIWHDYRSAASDDPAAAAVPSMDELRSAQAHTDFSLLEIDEANNTVRIADSEASIDVGALGKGYAVEMAAQHLEGLGVTSYVLNVGGNIRIIGTKPDGSGWVTGIRDPNNNEGNFATSLYLSDTSCVTSGVYERYYTVDGKRYHHVIDPDTLFPAEYFASLTVVTKDSALADALTTALFCMPYEEGLALVQQMEGVEVLWIFHNGESRHTPGMADFINKA